jgi:hypothetical protein
VTADELRRKAGELAAVSHPFWNFEERAAVYAILRAVAGGHPMVVAEWSLDRGERDALLTIKATAPFKRPDALTPLPMECGPVLVIQGEGDGRR